MLSPRLNCFLALFALTALLVSPPPGRTAPLPPAAPAPVGKIAKIIIVGTQNVPLATVRAALTEKAGDAYDPEAAEKDRAAVESIGPIWVTTVAATPDPVGGVDVTCTVLEYPIVRAIRFTANTPTKEPTIPGATLLAQMTTKPGQLMSGGVLSHDLAALFDFHGGYVTNQGYLFSVAPGLDIDRKTGVVTIPLIEFHIQAVKVTGLSPAKTADVLTKMHLKSGDLYNSGLLQNDLGAVYAAGFLSSRQPSFEVTAPGLVTLTVPLTERRTDAVAALDESQGRVVPFLYDPLDNLYPVIQVSVNGKPPLSFVVDTGTAYALLLDPWAAKELGMKPSPVTQQGDGYQYGTAPVGSLVFQGKDRKNDVSFNFSSANTQASVLDLSFFTGWFQNSRIAGIIGRAALEPVTTRFDFAAKTLTVFAYPHPPLRLPGATAVPLGLTSDFLYTVPVTLAPGVIDALILDTGAYSTQIHRSNVKAVRPTATSHTTGQRIEGRYVSPELRLPSLSLGTLAVPDVMVGTMEDSTRASLGLDILAGYRLTLDGPNRELILEPSASGGRYFSGRSGLSGWSGIEVVPDGSLSVKTLSPWSPARRAGVRVGDVITAVNGQNVQRVSPIQFRQAISGARPGREAGAGDAAARDGNRHGLLGPAR